MQQTIAQILQNQNPKVKRIKKPKLKSTLPKLTKTVKTSSGIIPQMILDWLELNPKSRPMDIQKGIGFEDIKLYLKILRKEEKVKIDLKNGQTRLYSKN